MKRVGPDICWLGLALLVVLLALAVSGPVMRESDQAALLEGAVEMARTGDLEDHGYYNFDKQFLSYWFLAGVLDVTGLDAPGAVPDEVVTIGNRAAAVFFSLALLIAFALAPRRDFTFLPVLLAAVLTPALIFSLPLLASNVFSGATLLLLAAAMRKRHAGIVNAVLCAALTAIAIGFRRDAAAVLPLLCLLSATRYSFGGLFKELRHWLMAGAAIGMVVCGHFITRQGYLYAADMFFDVRLFGGYVVFGMAGAAAVLFWLPFRLLTGGGGKSWFLRAATALAILLPFAVYTPLLYTPRHFFLSVLVLLFVLLLPRGERWWQVLQRRRLDRFVLWCAVIGSSTLWLVGFKFYRISKPQVVMSGPTLYPTADGFWPMGCYRNFLLQLKHAARDPIDHNQEVWEAWTQLKAKDLPGGDARIESSGLRPYGHLMLKLKGLNYVRGGKEGDFMLVEDRSIGRGRPAFFRSDGKAREIDWETCWLTELAGNESRRICLVEKESPKKRSIQLRWVARFAVVDALGKDDFHLFPGTGPADLLDEGYRGFRIAVLYEDIGHAELTARDLKADPGKARKVDVQPVSGIDGTAAVLTFVCGAKLSRSDIDAHGDPEWTARSVLPAFMSRTNY